MSGGHYEYKYYRLEELADDIERDFINKGKYNQEDFSANTKWGREPAMIEKDRLENATPEEKVIILDEVSNLIIQLRDCAKRSKELEWFLSGDTGPTSYLERLKKLKP